MTEIRSPSSESAAPAAAEEGSGSGNGDIAVGELVKTQGQAAAALLGEAAGGEDAGGQKGRGFASDASLPIPTARPSVLAKGVFRLHTAAGTAPRVSVLAHRCQVAYLRKPRTHAFTVNLPDGRGWPFVPLTRQEAVNWIWGLEYWRLAVWECFYLPA